MDSAAEIASPPVLREFQLDWKIVFLLFPRSPLVTFFSPCGDSPSCFRQTPEPTLLHSNSVPTIARESSAHDICAVRARAIESVGSRRIDTIEH
jgi:hypothetical protein